jgi:uncharacterized protein YijF (DUF1287 family)
MRLSSLSLVLILAPATAAGDPLSDVLARARIEVARGVEYDSSYVRLSYPNGDLSPNKGVCTDVVIRALRAIGYDLQSRVQQDIAAAPDAYSAWVRTPDSNIDHRRVGPLQVYFSRHAKTIALRDDDYRAGDVVVISFGCKQAGAGCYPHHIGIVSDKKGSRGLPLLIHNVGPTPSEDDSLDAWTRIAHFRIL